MDKTLAAVALPVPQREDLSHACSRLRLHFPPLLVRP